MAEFVSVRGGASSSNSRARPVFRGALASSPELPAHVHPRKIPVLPESFARLIAATVRRLRHPLTLGLVLLASCDIPSAIPHWETHWVVRSETTTIPVASFFSNDVSEVGNEFELAFTGGAISKTLADICPPCVPFNGTVIPKPAFTAVLESEVAFPVDLDSLTVTRGSLDVRVTNRLGFDPLRPAADPSAARGYMTIAISNASTVLATHTIDGAVLAFAPGTTIDRTIDFAAAALPRTIGGSVRFDVTIHSPQGDPVTINTAEFILVEAAQASIGASAAQVRVQDRHVAADPGSLDLSGVDEELSNRVQRGALLLDVDNPFAVGGTLTATLAAPGVTLVRSLPVVPGASTVSLDFSGAELRSLFGPNPATLSVAGPISATPAGPVTVRPGQALTASARLELYLTTNNPEDGQ